MSAVADDEDDFSAVEARALVAAGRIGMDPKGELCEQLTSAMDDRVTDLLSTYGGRVAAYRALCVEMVGVPDGVRAAASQLHLAIDLIHGAGEVPTFMLERLGSLLDVVAAGGRGAKAWAFELERIVDEWEWRERSPQLFQLQPSDVTPEERVLWIYGEWRRWCLVPAAFPLALTGVQLEEAVAKTAMHGTRADVGTWERAAAFYRGVASSCGVKAKVPTFPKKGNAKRPRKLSSRRTG